MQGADAVFREGRYAEAAALYRELSDSSAATGDVADQWEAQVKLAYALGLLGQREEADAEFVKTMELAAGDPYREGWTRVRKGSLYSRQGKFDLAQGAAMDARQLAEESGDQKLAATAWYLLGEIYSLTGRYREAVLANERRLEIARSSGASDSDIAHALSQIAIDYRHLGRHSEAAALLRQALAVYDRLGNPEGQARALYNLANVHGSAGDLDAAAAMMMQALDKAGQMENPRGLALVLNGLADVYTRAGNGAAAREKLTRALEINRDTRQPYGQATNLLSLGWLALEAGDVDTAEQQVVAAGTLADKHGYARQRAGVRAALAHIAAGRGDGDTALRRAEAALAIADSLDDPEARFEALESRAVAVEAAGHGDSAGAWLEAIDLLESWRGRLALGDLRMSVAEPRWSVYEGAIRVLLEQSRDAEAFAVAERARARLLLETMAERDTSRAANKETEIRLRLRERHAERAALADPEKTIALDEEIDELEQRLSALARTARTRNAAIGAARYPAPAPLTELQTALIGSGRAVLAFFWGERDVYGWWITADELRAARLGPVQELAGRIDFLRGALERPLHGPSWVAPAQAAFDTFVAPLSPALADEILVIADGPLAHIPIEVLTPEDGAEPLGATTRIVYGPSASVLLGLAKTPRPKSWDRSILVVGDPASGEGAAVPAKLQRDDPLAPLPYAAAEARAIYDLFRGERAALLIGLEATLEGWNALEPARYRYLHFAAHARVSAHRPEQTHLVLAGGHLDLAAIRELDLRSELVTLSACETAQGHRVRGEGIIGLSHAFLAAGARGAVVTLWRIEDEAAAEFMQGFYARLHDGSSPAEALLAVRRERIAAAGSDPADWAPFILVGGL